MVNDALEISLSSMPTPPIGGSTERKPNANHLLRSRDRGAESGMQTEIFGI